MESIEYTGAVIIGMTVVTLLAMTQFPRDWQTPAHFFYTFLTATAFLAAIALLQWLIVPLAMAFGILAVSKP